MIESVLGCVFSKYIFKKCLGCRILFEASVIPHCFALQKLVKITFKTSSTIIQLRALLHIF